jgi:gamma-hexachlorocyclohexane dehydrochlorinase
MVNSDTDAWSGASIAARLQIEQALADYAIGLDDRDADRWLAAFHDDAVFDVDFPPAILTGHAAILGWAQEVWRFQAITHLTGNHRIDQIEGDHAKGIGCGHGLFKLPDGQTILASARLLDRYERREGVWRIARRKVGVTSSFRLDGSTDLILNGVAIAA